MYDHELSAVEAEIVSALERDDTRMGDVWRGKAAGKTADEIATELGTQTSNFVSKYLRFARAMVTGKLPSAPTMIRECLSATKGFLGRHSDTLSDAAQAALVDRIQRLEALAENEEAVELEDKQIRQKAKATETLNIPGIYVYTLPHYFRQPVLPADGDTLTARTLMKVGMAENDVIKRFRRQERNTALPEDPWLLRIYTCSNDVHQTEQEIHRLLRAADHRQSTGRQAGTEWFLTSLRFLDEVATQKGLTVKYRIEDVESGEDSEI
jgi:hypothetical protein